MYFKPKNVRRASPTSSRTGASPRAGIGLAPGVAATYGIGLEDCVNAVLDASALNAMAILLQGLPQTLPGNPPPATAATTFPTVERIDEFNTAVARHLSALTVARSRVSQPAPSPLELVLDMHGRIREYNPAYRIRRVGDVTAATELNRAVYTLMGEITQNYNARTGLWVPPGNITLDPVAMVTACAASPGNVRPEIQSLLFQPELLTESESQRLDEPLQPDGLVLDEPLQPDALVLDEPLQPDALVIEQARLAEEERARAASKKNVLIGGAVAVALGIFLFSRK